MRPIALLAFLAMLTSCTETIPPVEPSPSTQITLIRLGDTVGFVSPEGAHVWRGLPFAAPPVDDLRWRAPRPPHAWEGVAEAVEFAERCTQISNGLDRFDGLKSGELIGSEDCLYLNVYAPPGGDNLPVMVWIHGGGQVWGRASTYDGSQLALDQNAIIITVQYRLGPLGWMSHPALRATAETPEDFAANFALLDLMAALRWTRQHAGSFGGDGGNITIFGESAGGHNVAGLLASPLAAGLFDRAIIQSGSASSISIADARGETDDIINASLSAVDDFTNGRNTPEAMRAASLDTIFAAYDTEGAAFFRMPIMIADGVTIPESGIYEAFNRPETFNAVPVITGTNRDEMRLFNGLDPALSRQTLGMIYRPRDRDYFSALSDYQSAMWAYASVDQIASAMVAGGHDDVWAYRFDWDEGDSNFFIDTPFLLGAAHGMEIPFVFNRFELFGRLDPILFNDDNAESRAALARQMGQHWGNMARNGDPGEGWVRWNAAGLRMRFDTHRDGGPEMVNGQTNPIDLADRLSTDARVTDEERCRIADAMQDRFFGDGASIRERLDCPV